LLHQKVSEKLKALFEAAENSNDFFGNKDAEDLVLQLIALVIEGNSKCLKELIQECLLFT